MAVHIDTELSQSQIAAMAAIPATSWFTQIRFRNAHSPLHPTPYLAVNNEMKQAMVHDWISDHVVGKRVLDLFCANGGFSFLAALAGASEVVGVDFSQERIQCAQFVASAIESELNCKLEFRQGDIYEIEDEFDAAFDVVLCLGGIYHIADPPYVLRQTASLVKERLILQTSQVLPLPGNWARFVVRRQDRTAAGMTSIRGGYGTWHYSPGCLRELILHGGFRIVEERQPPLLKRRRFPWYLANCEPLG
jgi:tRNA (mo5U34)-methyltransferase